ncbi:MAG: S9 family peptidase [Conexivisphaerales archaeon]
MTQRHQFKKEVTLDALFSVPSVSEFDVSRLSAYVVYTTNRSGQWQLMLTDRSVRMHKQLTNDEDSKMGPEFSPINPNELLFAKDRQGDEKFDIFLGNIKEERTVNLTPQTDYAIYPNPRFSPDGKKITFVSDKDGPFASYLLEIEERSITRLTEHGFSDHYCEVSPSGRIAVVASQVAAQDSNLFLVHLDSNKREVERFIDGRSGKPVEADDPSWSADGKYLAFVSANLGSYDIGIWNIENKEILWITDGKNECYSPVFSPDGKYLAYLRNTGANVTLELYDLMKNEKNRINFMNGVISSPKFSSSSEELYFVFSGPRNPPDLWSYNLRNDEFTQITNSLPESIDISNFAEGELIQYSSLKDGRSVPAVLYKPSRETKRAVVEIHGGPTAQALNSWNPFVQYLVSRGYVVIRPNYRGSTGFGKEYREANRFVMGDLDLADCVSAYNYLTEKGLADRDKVAVAGGSFGGYLTMCALTKYPSLWSCGVALVPFLNWFTEIKNEREDLRFWDLQNMGDPDNPNDRDRLRQASPIFYIDNIVAPVLLIAGANDPRCPMEETEQAREALEKKGKVVETKFYFDEGHGFRKTANRIDAYRRAVEFIEKYTFHMKK